MAAPNCYCGHRIGASTTTETGSCSSSCDSQPSHNDSSAVHAPSEPQHNVFCRPCSTRLLAAKISRYKAAIDTRNQERSKFNRRLLATRLVDNATINSNAELSLSTTRAIPDPNHIHQQASQLRQKLDTLRSTSHELAILVTSKTMENDERQERLELSCAKVDLARERLDSMRQNLLMSSTDTVQHSEEKKRAEFIHQNANVGGGLRDALVSGTRQIRQLRFHFALHVFEMHRIDVGEEYSNLTAKKESADRSISVSAASGVGKIGGLPLPHAGPALYGVLPQGMLASSLRLVASLTNLVARCLGVVLPHPILVCSRECKRCGGIYNYGGDIIGTAGELDTDGNTESSLDVCSTCEREDLREASEFHELHDVHQSEARDSSRLNAPEKSSSLLQKIPSKSSLFSFVGTSARKAVALATGSAHSSSNAGGSGLDSSSSSAKRSIRQPSAATHDKSLASTRCTSPSILARRVSHAAFAVLLENNETGAAEFALNPPRWKEETNHSNDSHHSSNNSNKPHGFSTRDEFHIAEEKFSTGLQLLQNDVIALCFRAGVDASSLWPAESLLLNLYSLQCHCLHVIGLE